MERAISGDISMSAIYFPFAVFLPPLSLSLFRGSTRKLTNAKTRRTSLKIIIREDRTARSETESDGRFGVANDEEKFRGEDVARGSCGNNK